MRAPEIPMRGRNAIALVTHWLNAARPGATQLYSQRKVWRGHRRVAPLLCENLPPSLTDSARTSGGSPVAPGRADAWAAFRRGLAGPSRGDRELSRIVLGWSHSRLNRGYPYPSNEGENQRFCYPVALPHRSITIKLLIIIVLLPCNP
jgi:hypothetical protein